MLRKRYAYLLLILVIPLWRCKEKYVNPHVSPSTGYLVVEGYLSGNSPTQFTLTRTISLPGDSALPMETHAAVQVEGDDNTSWQLKEKSTGVYGIDTLPLHTPVKYRLRVTTSGGSSYLSDFVEYKPTPAIDSISWINDANGVVVYANTHDPANTTRYYQWQDEETWEYHSAEYANYKYLDSNNTVVYRPPAEQIYRCWQSLSSTGLLIGSSAKLSQDLIYEYPLVVIPNTSPKISVLYSIFVTQTALTEDGYNYLSLMKKNTESLGSIFDAQPSILKGNIHSVSNPNEVVVGYISAGTVRQQRIFINRSQVRWNYIFICSDEDHFVPDNPDSLRAYFGGGFIPIDRAGMGTIQGYSGNQKYCVDCTSMGGTTNKPSYWPL